MMTKRLLFLATAIVLGLIVAYSPQLALADSLVSYAYTGPTYQYMTGGTPYVGQHLSMTFDFSAPLAYSTLWTDVTPLYWSVNDGVNQYSSTTCQTLSCSETFAFSADTNGA